MESTIAWGSFQLTGSFHEYALYELPVYQSLGAVLSPSYDEILFTARSINLIFSGANASIKTKLDIGIKTQRIRECSGGRKLNRVLPNDIFCEDNEKPLLIVKKLISKLYETFPFDLKTKEKISDYLNCTQLRNENEYKEIIARYPRPLLHDSIEVTHPQISQEWHPDRNGDLIPNMFSKGSGHKAWWLCWICWHEWKTSISHRTDTKATGCPECSQIKRYITRTKNLITKNGSLKKNNPKLAQEWHPTLNIPLTPSDVTSGSDRKVWWKCKKCGNAWEAFIYSRNQGRGCSKCK